MIFILNLLVVGAGGAVDWGWWRMRSVETLSWLIIFSSLYSV